MSEVPPVVLLIVVYLIGWVSGTAIESSRIMFRYSPKVRAYARAAYGEHRAELRINCSLFDLNWSNRSLWLPGRAYRAAILLPHTDVVDLPTSRNANE